MAIEQQEYDPDLSRRDGFAVIRQVEGHLQIVSFREEKADAEDLAEDEAAVSSYVLFVMPATRFAREGTAGEG